MVADLDQGPLDVFAQLVQYGRRHRLATTDLDQLFGDVELLLVQGRLLAATQQRQRQHVGPRLLQQGREEARYALARQAVADRLLGADPREFKLFLAARGLDVAALGDLGLARQGLHLLLQITHQAFEDRRVAHVVVGGPLDDDIDLLEQSAIGLVGIQEPAGAGLRDHIQHLPRGMLPAGEEPLVGKRHPQHRDLQLGQQAGGRARLLDIAQDVLVEQVHQFDGVRLLGAQGRAHAGRRHLAQLRQQILLEVGKRARRRLAVHQHRRRLAGLQQRQHGLHVVAGSDMGVRRRLGLGPAQLAQQGAAARQKLAQHVEHAAVGSAIRRAAARRVDGFRAGRTRPGGVGPGTAVSRSGRRTETGAKSGLLRVAVGHGFGIEACLGRGSPRGRGG